MNNPSIIFVDTDAFVAFVKKDDSNHKKAVKLFEAMEKKPVMFTTSNYVFSEAVTVISQRVGRDVALDFINELKSPANAYDIKWVTEEIEMQAIEKYKQQTSKNVSFTDCTNMVMLDTYGIDSIFSFDSIYKKNGYNLATEETDT